MTDIDASGDALTVLATIIIIDLKASKNKDLYWRGVGIKMHIRNRFQHI